VFRHLRTKLTVLYAGLFGVSLVLVSATVYGVIAANAERAVRGELEASGTASTARWPPRTGEASVRGRPSC